MLIKEILLGLLALALIMRLDLRVSNKFNNKKMKYVIEKIIEKEAINQFSLIDDNDIIEIPTASSYKRKLQ